MILPQARTVRLDNLLRRQTHLTRKLAVEVQFARDETEGQREDERFDLDAKGHPHGMGVDEDEPGGGSEGTETEDERLRAGVEEMNRRIAEIERRLQMVQQDLDFAPPSYFSEVESLPIDRRRVDIVVN